MKSSKELLDAQATQNKQQKETTDNAAAATATDSDGSGSAAGGTAPAASLAAATESELSEDAFTVAARELLQLLQNDQSVNPRKHVVVGASWPHNPPTLAFRWTATTGMQTLSRLSGYTSTSAASELPPKKP